MTKAEALKHFRELYKTMGYRKGDDTAKRTEWNDYTDGLCKDGLITLHQYEKWGQPF